MDEPIASPMLSDDAGKPAVTIEGHLVALGPLHHAHRQPGIAPAPWAFLI